MSRFVVTVIIYKCHGRQQTPCYWQRSLVCPATLVGSYIPPELPLIGNLIQCLWCIALNLAVDVREVFSQWSDKQASLHCVGKSRGILNKYWFNWDLSASLFAVVMRTSAKCCKRSCSKRSKFAWQTCYSRCHKIGYFFVLSPAYSTPLGSLHFCLGIRHSVPNNSTTPNDIRAYQTTSFVWIHQWKLYTLLC